MMLIDPPSGLSLHRMTQVQLADPGEGGGRGVTTDRIDHLNTRRRPLISILSVF
jgi:hypothetical protein